MEAQDWAYVYGEVVLDDLNKETFVLCMCCAQNEEQQTRIV